MAELDKPNPVSLQELMVSTLAMTDALAKLLIEKGRHHGCGVQAEAAGRACGLPAHPKSVNAVIVLGETKTATCLGAGSPSGELMAKY
jgi:hypothetical protein